MTILPRLAVLVLLVLAIALPATLTLPAQAQITRRGDTYVNYERLTERQRARRVVALEAGEFEVLDNPPSMARMLALWRDIDPALIPPSMALTMRCPLFEGTQAHQLLAACSLVEVKGLAPHQQEAATLLASRYASYIGFRPTDAGRQRLDYDRHYFTELDVRIDTSAIAPPRVPPPTRKVAFSLLAQEIIYARLQYPSRALRQELEGRLTMRCQVLEDLSLFCDNPQFDPAKDGQVFIDQALRRLPGVQVEENLQDGTPAAGVQFDLVIRYQIA